MGSQWFETYQDGADAQAAFDAAVEQAQWEHGHDGYTGTIAEKDDYLIITEQAVSREEADRLATTLWRHEDRRIDDKWGPAGAIPVTQTTTPGSGGTPEGWLFCGWASC